MENLETRFQAIMSKSKQIESEKNFKNKIENDLIDINAALVDIAKRIEDRVRDLVFIDLDDFLHDQNFTSQVHANKGKSYKLNNNEIEWSPTNVPNRKIAFLVKQNIIQSVDHKVEVSFKDPTVTNQMRIAKQGISIIGDKSTEELSNWLKQLESTKDKLDSVLSELSLNDITFEVPSINSKQFTKTPKEVMLTILEN